VSQNNLKDSMYCSPWSVFAAGLTAAFLCRQAAAAELPMPALQSKASWHLPGNERAAPLQSDTPVIGEVLVPALTTKEVSAEGEWRGILSIDVFGTADGARGDIQIEAFDLATDQVFATTQAVIEGKRAPRAKWVVIASSAHGGAAAASAFDGDRTTDWHTRYGKNRAEPPHWNGLAFSEPRLLKGVRVLPRQGGFTNGVPRAWKLEVLKKDTRWQRVDSGETDRASVADRREAFDIQLTKPRPVMGFRFVIEKDWSGGGFGTAAEVTPLGLTLEQPEDPVLAKTRAWLEIPPARMAQLAGTSFGIRLTGTAGQVVVGIPQWCRVNTQPSKKLFGRSNGGLGPDKLGAGLLGFTALTEQNQTVLTVISVERGGPAEQAGLLAGDAIVSVDQRPLPVNDLNPGWKWFHQSHEARLGRASEAALAAGRTTLTLGVLRNGKVMNLPIHLRRTAAFTTLFPEDDPQAAALLADLITWLEENQREDGSWSGDIKRTTFAALALLATEKKPHERRVRKAIQWALDKFDTPEKHGNLGFWGGSYMGILYAEWYLRTNDERVLPHLEAMRDWAYEGQHPSIWAVPALGHGPSGLPYGQKSLVAPACHLLVFESLAKRCGMKSKLWELLMPYMELAWSDPKDGGHGALGYNKSYKDLQEFWSRSGLFAMACCLRNDRPDIQIALTTFMRERHPWLRNSHAYGEPGGGLGLLSLQLVSPDAYAEILPEYAWWFSLAWKPGEGLKFTQPHMGAPYMGEDDLLNCVYALVLQSPKRNLHLTGKNP